jgi:hypothetical protein
LLSLDQASRLLTAMDRQETRRSAWMDRLSRLLITPAQAFLLFKAAQLVPLPFKGPQIRSTSQMAMVLVEALFFRLRMIQSYREQAL